MIDRKTHLQQCKDEAKLSFKEGMDPNLVWDLFVSNLKKHPHTAHHIAIELGTMLNALGHLENAGDVKKFIEDFR